MLVSMHPAEGASSRATDTRGGIRPPGSRTRRRDRVRYQPVEKVPRIRAAPGREPSPHTPPRRRFAPRRREGLSPQPARATRRVSVAAQAAPGGPGEPGRKAGGSLNEFPSTHPNGPVPVAGGAPTAPHRSGAAGPPDHASAGVLARSRSRRTPAVSRGPGRPSRGTRRPRRPGSSRTTTTRSFSPVHMDDVAPGAPEGDRGLGSPRDGSDDLAVPLHRVVQEPVHVAVTGVHLARGCAPSRSIPRRSAVRRPSSRPGGTDSRSGARSRALMCHPAAPVPARR